MFQILLCMLTVSIAVGNSNLNLNVRRENVTQLSYTNKLEKVNVVKNISLSLSKSKKQDDKSYVVETAVKSHDLRKPELLNKSSNYSNSRTVSVNETQRTHFLLKIHATITRSKDAVWATITLTFLCVILVIAVAQSRMWKNYRGTESQGVPLPNFNEKVLFRDVMEHRMNSLKQIFKKKKKTVSEMESLLPASEWE